MIIIIIKHLKLNLIIYLFIIKERLNIRFIKKKSNETKITQ